MMRKFLLFFMLLLINKEALAKPPLPEKLTHYIERLEGRKRELQGGAFAVVYKGEVVYKTTFGTQKEGFGPITSKTLFPLASVSKPVAAIATALLARRSKVDYGRRVTLPFFREPVSLTHILSHTSGVAFTGNAQIEAGTSRLKILAQIKKQKPACKPGTCYFYSNLIYGAVDEVLKTQNLSLEEAFQTLRKALDREDFVMVAPAPSAQVAYPHVEKTTKKGKVLKSLSLPPYYPKAAPAAAGIYASLDAMIEVFKLGFGYRPDLMDQASLDHLYTPLTLNKDLDKWHLKEVQNLKKIDSGYGLGMRVLKKKGAPESPLFFHSGRLAGINTAFAFMPAQEIGIILLVNQDASGILGPLISFWETYEEA